MITVLMSVYNSAAYLHQAIRSTLRQTHRDFQFLIVDDGSSDRSLEICREYAARDPRIEIIAHENWGAPASLNDAAAQARGDWLFRMDPDDIMLPNRLSRQMAFLRRNKDLAVASSQVLYINDRGQTVGQSRSPLTTRAAVAAVVAGEGLVALFHPAVAMRKDVFLKVGGYRKQCWPADDLDLWTRIAESGYRVLVQDEFLVKYRLHGASVSMSGSRVQVQTVDWVGDCKRRRQGGEAERSFADYLAEQQSRPVVQRLNWHRKIAARTLYKSGVQRWVLADYVRGAPALAGAFALSPALFTSRVIPRLASLVGRGRPARSAAAVPPVAASRGAGVGAGKPASDAAVARPAA
jgi:hypothetical protein